MPGYRFRIGYGRGVMVGWELGKMERVIEYRTCHGTLRFERQSDGSLLPLCHSRRRSVLTADMEKRLTVGSIGPVLTVIVAAEGSNDRDAG
jgi:hypothetical protein